MDTFWLLGHDRMNKKLETFTITKEIMPVEFQPEFMQIIDATEIL
jgi:hypothetical protein